MSNPFAFPVATNGGLTEQGMTLRDYFAGQALIGYLTNEQTRSAIARISGSVTEKDKVFAAACYELADAMLQEREKGAK